MSEARKLGPSGLPDIPVTGLRPESAELPPLPPEPAYGEARAVSAAPQTRDPEPLSRKPQRIKRSGGGFGRALLILSLIGVASFASGAGLTAGIVLGNIDTKSGRLKDVIQSTKALIQQLKS